MEGIVEQSEETKNFGTESFSKEKLEKMQPDWNNPPTVSALQTEVDEAKLEHDAHMTEVNRWYENFSMTGSAAPIKKKGRSAIAPKLIRKQAEWRYPGLSDPFLSTSDLFNVSPVTAGDVKRARQNALVLNNQFNTHIDKVDFIDSYVRDAVDTGTVIAKTGWYTEEEEITEDVPTYSFEIARPEEREQLFQKYKQLVQLKSSAPFSPSSAEQYADFSNPGLDEVLKKFIESQGQVIYSYAQTGVEQVTKTVETANYPTVEICDIENVVFDPSCKGKISKAKFVAEIYKTSLSDLETEGRYLNTDCINIDNSTSEPISDPDYTEKDDSGNFNFSDKYRKLFTMWEYWGYWDIQGDGVLVPIVACWVGNVMIRLEENPFPDRKHPYTLAKYMPRRKSIYGEPDGELIEDNQQIIGATTRGMVDLLGRSANSQTGTASNFLDGVNKRKYKNGDDYEFQPNADPRSSVHTHTYPEIPRAAHEIIGSQHADAESLTGVKAYHTGINATSLGNVATGVRSVMDAATKRELGILNRLAKGIIEIGRKMIAMNAEFLSEKEVIRVTAEKFVTVRRDDLAGKFDLRLSISTAEEDDSKAKELAFMLQTNGPNSDPAEARIIRAEIARLRKMPELAKKIEEYRPEPDPFTLKKQELELALLQAQIRKEISLEVKHLSTADLDKTRGYKEGTQGNLNAAKTQTESAKTRNLNSLSDNQDLDFVEKESGVTQARETEKLDRASQSKIAEKVIDNYIKEGNNSEKTI